MGTAMKVLTCREPGRLVLSEAPVPVPQPGEVLLRVRRVGVCGTDLHAYEGTQPYFTYPRILGHELGCEVADPNGCPGLRSGEAVTVIPYFSCGGCTACRKGRANCCATLEVFGVHVDGGLREYIAVPAPAVVKGEGLSPDALALVEPLAIGAHGIRRAGLTAGEDVLVVGAGPIGLGLMRLAALAGARVIAMDINPLRLENCRSTAGVTHVVDAGRTDTEARIRELTDGRMPDVVIDATGNLAAIRDAFRYLAHAGRYVLVGLQKGEIGFSHPEFHRREATLLSSRNATPEDFRQVLGHLHDGTVDVTAFITHHATLEDVVDRFPEWMSPASGVVKAMVHL
jgi:2-desacetyl-2-hydroxyethyl bacteriochlorophyllide A dehydrogenase